jgi:GNAT superfamily N-acetyltransferase
MTVSRETFTQRVLHHWAERYETALEALHEPGLVLRPEPDYAGSRGIHAWHIARHTFVRFDPALQTALRELLSAMSSPASLELGQLTAALQSSQVRVSRTELALLSYVYPPDFRSAVLPPAYAIRQLDPGDAQAMSELKAACRADEIEEAEVSVEDEIAFGCFSEHQLAAVATGFTLTGFMDIGVLTHPAFRQQGLGQAAVSILCAWCLERDILPQYRCSEANVASHKLAQGLGFATLVRSEHAYIEPDIVTE